MQEAESTLWPTIALCTYITLNPVPSLIGNNRNQDNKLLPTILSSLHFPPIAELLGHNWYP